MNYSLQKSIFGSFIALALILLGIPVHAVTIEKMPNGACVKIADDRATSIECPPGLKVTPKPTGKSKAPTSLKADTSKDGGNTNSAILGFGKNCCKHWYDDCCWEGNEPDIQATSIKTDISTTDTGGTPGAGNSSKKAFVVPHVLEKSGAKAVPSGSQDSGAAGITIDEGGTPKVKKPK